MITKLISLLHISKRNIAIKQGKDRKVLTDNRKELYDVAGVKEIATGQEDLYRSVISRPMFKQVEAGAYAYFLKQKKGIKLYERNQAMARFLVFLMFENDYKNHSKNFKTGITVFACAALLYGIPDAERSHIIKSNAVERELKKIYDMKQHMLDSIKHIEDDYDQADDFNVDATKARNNFLMKCSVMPLTFFFMAEAAATFMFSYNMYTSDRQREYLKQSIVMGDIALALGFEKFKAEMDNELLQKSARKMKIKPILKTIKKKYEKKYKDLYVDLDNKIRKLNIFLKRYGVNSQISGRVKSLYSIYNKTQGRYKGKGLEKMGDIIALRVIVNSLKELNKVRDRIPFFDQMIKVRDLVDSPSENGYQSVHYKFIGNDGKVYEIQLRTVEQHIHAETRASHIAYKYGSDDDFFTEPLFIPTDTKGENELRLRMAKRYRKMVLAARTAGKHNVVMPQSILDKLIPDR